MRSRLHRIFFGGRNWVLVPCAAIKPTPRTLLVLAAPLFKEECRSIAATKIANLLHPIGFHFPRTWSAFTANDRPLDADQIAQLERKIGQQAMEIEFLKKALRRFREHPLPVVANGNAVSISKSNKRPMRGQR